MAEVNSTKGDLEELNGLLAEELKRRIKEGIASSSDLNAAVRLLSHNRVEAEDPDAPRAVTKRIPENEFPFPIEDGD